MRRRIGRGERARYFRTRSSRMGVTLLFPLAALTGHCACCPHRQLGGHVGYWALGCSCVGKLGKYWPAVPWAVPPTAVYLWLFWRYIRGEGSPRSTAEARRTNCRANRLTEEVWGAALFAGGLGLVALLPFLRVMNRLFRLPAQPTKTCSTFRSSPWHPGWS